MGGVGVDRTVQSLPLAVRGFNRVGRGLQRLGIARMRIDAEALMAQARQRTGLEDFGGESHRAGLDRLLVDLEEQAALTPLGRILVRAELLRFLENRLRLTDWHRRHPEIGRGEIRRPIVIIGMARTGTTILHDLVAQDRTVRVPLSWEVDQPFPPPERATYDTDPRISACQRQIDRSEWILPSFKSIHPMGATLPQECVAFTTLEFASMMTLTQYRVPRYGTWLHDEADMGPTYALHRRVLQLLQWRMPADRWVLKSPGHLYSLDALLREYPDACLVQTHRDPLRILASLANLVAVLRSLASDRIDRHEIARECAGWLQKGLDRSVEARRSGLVRPDQVFDLHFAQFMADPTGSVRRIYERFDMEWTPEAESRMRAFLARESDAEHGKHRYRFADTGLDLGEEREKLQRYLEYFDVPRERVE